MGILAIILIIVAVIVFLPGLFVAGLKFLLFVGIILAILAVLSWLFGRTRSGR